MYVYVPVDVQVLEVSELQSENELHTHVPCLQIGVDPEHACPEPHLHSPEEHVSVDPLHAALVPHWHAPFVQVSELPWHGKPTPEHSHCPLSQISEDPVHSLCVLHSNVLVEKKGKLQSS